MNSINQINSINPLNQMNSIKNIMNNLLDNSNNPTSQNNENSINNLNDDQNIFGYANDDIINKMYDVTKIEGIPSKDRIYMSFEECEDEANISDKCGNDGCQFMLFRKEQGDKGICYLGGNELMIYDFQKEGSYPIYITDLFNKDKIDKLVEKLNIEKNVFAKNLERIKLLYKSVLENKSVNDILVDENMKKRKVNENKLNLKKNELINKVNSTKDKEDYLRNALLFQNKILENQKILIGKDDEKFNLNEDKITGLNKQLETVSKLIEINNDRYNVNNLYENTSYLVLLLVILIILFLIFYKTFF